MTEHHTPTPSPVAASEGEFLQRVLDRIDRWFDNDADLDELDHARGLLRQRLTALDAAPEALDEGERGDPVVALIAAELHRLGRDLATATVITRGGHIHDHVRIQAVHRHHAVLSRGPHQAGVLLPLAFIESVHHRHPPIRQE